MRASGLGKYFCAFLKTVCKIPSKIPHGAAGVGRKTSVVDIFTQLSLPFYPEKLLIFLTDKDLKCNKM